MLNAETYILEIFFYVALRKVFTDRTYNEI